MGPGWFGSCHEDEDILMQFILFIHYMVKSIWTPDNHTCFFNILILGLFVHHFKFSTPALAHHMSTELSFYTWTLSSWKTFGLLSSSKENFMLKTKKWRLIMFMLKHAKDILDNRVLAVIEASLGKTHIWVWFIGAYLLLAILCIVLRMGWAKQVKVRKLGYLKCWKHSFIRGFLIPLCW